MCIKYIEYKCIRMEKISEWWALALVAARKATVRAGAGRGHAQSFGAVSMISDTQPLIQTRCFSMAPEAKFEGLS